MKLDKGVKYLAGFMSILVSLIVLNWFISSRMAGTNFIHQHTYMAFNVILIKTIFVGGILFYLLPFFSKNRNLPYFIIQILAWLAICFFAEQYIQRIRSKPDFQGMHAHHVLGNNSEWWMSLLIYLFLLLVLFVWYFTKEWIKSEKQKRELIEARFSTEVLFLKNQVNPHFLFNTLNNLFSIAQRNKDEETAQGLSQLAGLMRYMIYDSSVTHISLEKEIKNIDDFIALSKLRYPNDEVEVQLTRIGPVENIKIAPMIFLPFVENAFKHGIHIEEKSTISITFEVMGSALFFTCTNQIVDASIIKHTEYGGIGLENVQRRLILLYPQKHKLSITNSGSTFIVHLELHT
ncbi:MAG: histidine kinase [Saprospiraceae bacterium]